MTPVLRAAVALLLLSPGLVWGGDSLRPEVSKPLQAAQTLLKQQKYQDALAQVAAADAVSGKTPYESFIVERMRSSAALGAGQVDVAAKSSTAVIATGRLSKDEMKQVSQSMVIAYYRDKQYAKVPPWVHSYEQYGGADPAVDQLLAQSDFLAGNYADAAKELRQRLDAQGKAGEKPTEDELQLLANCALKQKDDEGYRVALEQLVRYYPKKDYWIDLISRLQAAGSSDLLNLDIYRLKRATGTLSGAGDYVEMTEMSLQSGCPAEALQVLAEGYQAKVLGNGPEAARQQRLKDLAQRQAAGEKPGVGQPVDADAKINAGYDLVVGGKADAGIAMMKAAIAQGGLKNPDVATLRLGEAALMAGRAADASRAFQAVRGGAKGLARLWDIQASRKQ